MRVELSEKFLKWLILESLPTSFDAVKLTYNALKEEWTLEELMPIVVQHEVSLKKNETHSLALVIDQVSNMKKKPLHTRILEALRNSRGKGIQVKEPPMHLLILILQRVRDSRGSATFATSKLIASSLKIG